MFNHGRLKCYVLSLDAAKMMPGLISNWPTGSGYLIDQLRRAMSSVVLNIAEGNGRRSFKERRRFFDIAIGSASEVASILDIALAFGYISQGQYDNLCNNLLQVVKMLYKLK